MPISLVQHRAAITQSVIAFFQDDTTPLEGLAAFFPVKTSPDKFLSIEVRRGRQLVAVDVSRYDANRNTFSKSTEKIFQPPYFNEFFDFTSTDRYDMTWQAILSGGTPNVSDLQGLIKSGASYAVELKNKIARAKEIQRAAVLQTGIVTLVNGDSIDFKRKAASMVTKTSTATWDNATTATPLTDLAAGGTFIRQVGLTKGKNVINAIMGQNAYANFMACDQVTNGAKFYNQILRTDIGMPQMDEVTGMTYMGRIGTGDFIFNLWTYADFYEDASGNKINYIDQDTVVLLPMDFEGYTAHAGVPSIMGDATNGQVIMPTEGEYYVRDVIDPKRLTWEFYISSSPLAIPVSIDKLYTIKTK